MNKKVIAVAALASVAIVAIWYVAIYSSQSHSIHKSRVAAAASNVQAGTLRTQIATLEEEKTQLPQAQAKLATLSVALPNVPALDKLVDQINNDAVTTGVDWQNITPTKPTIFTPGNAPSGFPSNMQAVPVTLQVEGTYKDVLAFVSDLNSLPRLVDVDGVTFNGVGDGGKTIAQLSTEMFFIPSASTTATTVAP